MRRAVRKVPLLRKTGYVAAAVLLSATLLYPVLRNTVRAQASPTGTNDVIANLFMWP